MASQRIEGPTPSGGAYALMVFLRSVEEPVEVEAAAAQAVAITEYDSDDVFICETVARLAAHETPVRLAAHETPQL